MNERSKRQSFLGSQSDEILGGLRVAIVGLGGGGSHIVQQLAHIGIGYFVLFDHDQVEESNLNRLVGATLNDVQNKEWKVCIGSRVIHQINPQAQVITEKTRWQERAELLRDCDIIFGCVDSFAARNELERAARRYLTPYIDIGMDVHESNGNYIIGGQVALSMPGEACLHCMNILRPELIAQEAAAYGVVGNRPQVVWPNGVLASMAVGIIMQLVTPWHNNHQNVILLEYDGNAPEVRASSSTSFLRGKRCSHFTLPNDLGDPWYANKVE